MCLIPHWKGFYIMAEAKEYQKMKDIYGSLVFDRKEMKQRLPQDVFENLAGAMEGRQKLDSGIADTVALAMKDWAVSKGADHWAHWFHPLTELTAEKHTAFLTADENGNPLNSFRGKDLMQSEPDASSFPSGGTRSTFEARGYSAWDPTSPAFIIRSRKGGTLCIPSIFIAYDGSPLDLKTFLLRSMQAVESRAMKMLKLFGNRGVRYVHATVGGEQEFFLLDRPRAQKRPDIRFCGRTLVGSPPPRDQKMEDHYFGAIPTRVLSYMEDVQRDLARLGVDLATRHNENARCQFEFAPQFTEANLACDQNQLTMEMMKKIADKHGLVCLQHEKPFEGVNGSGKHNNWSMSTTHENLLDPGDTPMENLQFLVFLAAVIKAVDEYADLLRTSVATPGNDHRLGANEAPPAIISIFVGEELEAVIDAIASDSPYAGPVKMKMDLGVDVLPKFSKDTTDRNRTSPFAFTGNKFEFRMPGSAENLSDANTILNTAVAKALKEFVAETSGAADFECAAAAWVKKTLNAHRRVIFNGNGYSEAWEAEAERRGLPNRKCTPDAMIALKDEKNIELMEEFGVLTKTEMLSRYEVEMEHYSKILNIEARTMLKIANKQLIPAASAYMGELASSAAAKAAAVEGISTKAESKVLVALSKYTDEMSDAADDLKAVTDKVSDMDNEAAKAHAFHDEVIPAMDRLRAAADQAEELVDEDFWPLPCYSRMLFYTE